MRNWLVGCWVSALVLVPVASALAVTDSFTIGLLVPDNEPPTTPTLLSADPVAFDTIDLTWSSSTDDVIVLGYVVDRDGSPIATTTLTSYSDTGLAGSTTYSYSVRAFDHFYNYSSSSNVLATTTPPEPVVVVPTSTESTTVGSGGTIARAVLRNLQVITDTTSAKLEIRTAHPTRIEVRWGKTDAYELGYTVNGSMLREHHTTISDLEPGTTYRYEVTGYTPYGVATVLQTGTFSTVSDDPARTLPVNVRAFTAAAVGDDVTLRWQLPAQRAASVRLVRSHLGFPLHPLDGKIVYEGLGTTAVDVGVLATYSPVYYTAFVYDQAGNISSGAVAVAYRAVEAVPSGLEGMPDDGGQAVVPGSPSQEPMVPPAVATSSVTEELVTDGMILPDLTDIQVRQGSAWQSFAEGLDLEAAQVFTILVPKRAVSGNLKSIIATVVDGASTESSYLLRLNKAGDAYEAVVPVASPGSGMLAVAVYDYQAYTTATYETPAEFTATGRAVLGGGENGPGQGLVWLATSFFGLCLLMLMVVVWWVLWRRRTEDNG